MATREGIRELAERTSSGTLIRLFWLQGTSSLWVDLYEPELDLTIVIPATPERALETFHHPYAYATADSVLWRRGSCIGDCPPDGAREANRAGGSSTS